MTRCWPTMALAELALEPAGDLGDAFERNRRLASRSARCSATFGHAVAVPPRVYYDAASPADRQRVARDGDAIDDGDRAALGPAPR